MRNQPEPQKPEWFELLDGDAPSAQVSKVDKKLPILAAVVIGAAVLSGTIFAGANGGAQESAVAATSQVDNAAGATNQVDNATAATNQTVSGTTSEAIQPSNNSIAQDGSIQNPTASGVKPPRGGGDDDDDHDDDDDDDDDDDHDDRRKDRERDEH